MKTLLAILILTSTCAYAQDHRHVRHCSNATLRGNYRFTISGTRPTGPPPAPLATFVGLAIANYDGQGNLTQTYGTSHGSINGDSSTDLGSGTYSINEDCSGTMVLNLTGRIPAVSLKLWIVVVDGGVEANSDISCSQPS